MTDKNVQRNVRSSGKEGIETPTEKHFHSLGEKDNSPLGERGKESSERKKSILARFKERERKWRKKAEQKE